MPRRDGQPTLQELAGARQPAPAAGGQLPPAEAARAALAATAAAAGTAATAPPVIAPAVTVAAVNAAAAGILTAFGDFLRSRRRDQETYLTSVLEAEIPELPALARQQVISDEMAAEKAYAVKARDRLAHDLPLALSITDPRVREAQVQKILDRERRYAEMRESAMAARALGVAEQQHVERVSPEGGYWHESDHVEHHTLDCLAMAGKIWPHSVLRNYHPPLHGGCPCEIWSIQRAQEAGLVQSPEQWATPDQAIQAMQIAEASFDVDDFDDEMVVLEAVQARWWKVSGRPGQFRARKGDLGAGVRKMPVPHIPGVPDPDRIRDLASDELHLRELAAKDLGPRDRVMIDGGLQAIRAVLAPGVFELESGHAVRMLGDTAMGIAADPEETPDVTEASWEHEHRTRKGEWTFTELAPATDWAHREFGDWLEHLSPEHAHAVGVYKHGEDPKKRYRQMNRALRGRAEWTADARRFVPLVQEAVSAHQLSEPVIVHRAVPLSDLSQWPPDVGRHIHEPGFMSTSLVPSVPEENYSNRRGETPVHLHISLGAGTPAGYLDPVGDKTEDGEILLPPGIRMRVESSHVDDQGRNHVHLTATHVGPPRGLPEGSE